MRKISKKTIKRTVRTFIQAFAGSMISVISCGVYDITEWKSWGMSVLISAIASGIAAVMNLEKEGD